MRIDNNSLMNAASSLGQELSGAQSEMLSAAKSGDPGKIQAADIKLKQKQAAFQALTNIVKAIFDTMMAVIRNLRVS